MIPDCHKCNDRGWRIVSKAGDPVPGTTNTRFASTLYETCSCRTFTVTKTFTFGEPLTRKDDE